METLILVNPKKKKVIPAIMYYNNFEFAERLGKKP